MGYTGACSRAVKTKASPSLMKLGALAGSLIVRELATYAAQAGFGELLDSDLIESLESSSPRHKGGASTLKLCSHHDGNEPQRHP